MSMRRANLLNNLEIPRDFPVTHGATELPPFPVTGRGEMLHELVAEELARNRALLEAPRRVLEVRWESGRLFVVVPAARNRGAERELVLDAVEAARARFDASALFAAGDSAQRRRTIVEAPVRLGRRPGPFDEAFVAVDGRRI